MKNKNSVFKKALSVLLTALLVFGTVSLGIVFPETKITANAATYNCNSISAINSAIASANSAGAGTQTVIKLSGDISVGETSALTAITGNVLFDFAGHNITCSYENTGLGNTNDSNQEYQLPSDLQSSGGAKDSVTKGIFNIASSGTMQIINSGSANSQLKVYTYAYANDSNGRHTLSKDRKNTTFTTSSSAIYSEGTLIIGDRSNSGNNNFTIWSQARAGTDDDGYDTRNMACNAYAVTVNNENAKFFMYGGTLDALACSRSNYNGNHNDRCFTLNIVKCYSSEIYGGTISIPENDECGLRNSDSHDSGGGTSYFAAIRTNDDNVFVFNVESTVDIYVGADTGSATAKAANVQSTATANAPLLYGGTFTNNSDRSGSGGGTLNKYAFLGSYNLAYDSSIYPAKTFGSDNTASPVNLGTLFYFGDENTANGIYPWEYATFRDYVNAHTAENDAYYKVSATHMNDGNNYKIESDYNYRRYGYSQVGWNGTTIPGTSSSNGTYTNCLLSGSLFLFPKWQLNTYKIEYDLNDETDNYKATLASPITSYNVTSTSSLPSPTRPGYTFLKWMCSSVTYLDSDNYFFDNKLKTKPWTEFLSVTDTNLNGKVGAIKLQALWKEIEYTATFTLDGGAINGSTDSLTATYNVNGNFTFPSGYSKDYYNSDNNWKVTSADGNWAIDSTLYDSDSVSPDAKYGNPVFTAQYTPIQYTVAYDSDGGSNIEDTSVMAYNIESTHSLPVSTRQGYKLVGWQVVTTDDEKWSKDTTYAAGYKFTGMHGNVSLKAVWETMTSTVTLNIGADESISGNTVLTYAYSSSLALNTPSKKGYTFKGWRVSAKGDGENTWNIGDEYLLAAGETSVTLPGGKLGDVTLTPIWEINTYTVNFNSDGGTAYDAKTFTVTDSITLPSPEKNGYTFAGWSVPIHDTEYNWTDTVYNGNQTLTGMYGSVTLKANWTKTPYTVTFDANGGTVTVASLPYDIESGTPNLPTPSKTGYEFDRWVVDSADAQSSWTNGAEYTDALPAGNYGSLTLKAQWKPVEYTINFSDGTTKTYTIEETFTLPESVKDGYEFVKWTLTSTNGNWGETGKEYVAGEELSGMWGAAVLQAEYTPCSYTVTYLDTDGSQIAAQTFKTGDEITLRDYSKDGYIFRGWTVQSSAGNWGGEGSVITDKTVAAKYGDVTLEPKLEAIEYTVTFLPDGGDAVPAITYTAEDTITMPSTAKYGYDLAGWTVETPVGSWTDGKTFAANDEVTGKWGNVTLKAKWTPKKYNITFITGTGEQVVQSEYGQATPTLPDDYSKPADAQYTYTFDHWEPALTKVTADATYTAVYKEELNSYTVTWRVLKTEDGTDWEETTATWKYGEEPKFDGVPTQNANSTDHRMRFVGWTPDVIAVTGNATYKAVFAAIENPQTVEWYNGSTLLASTEWAKNETPSYSGAVPARADEGGYKFVFVGWAMSDGGEKLDAIPTVETVSTEPVQYYAVFDKQPQSYTLTLDADGGTISGGSTVSYTYGGENTKITLPSPVKDGYVFKGWLVASADGDGTLTVGNVYNAGENTADVYGSASLKAQWETVTYTLTFDGEGVTVDSMDYTIESTDTLPTAEKEGCEHIGWLVSAADGSWTLGASISTDFVLTGSFGDATLTPVYRAKTYTIKWVSGEYVQTSEVQFGSVIFAFEPISKQGYTAEWDAEIPATMPATDLTFTAVYKPIEYFLRLELNGGTGAESFYYTFDGDAVLPTPARDGATFDGWRVVSSNGNWTVGTVLAGGTALAGRYGSTTLSAQWQLEIHTVTWVAGDETRVTRWYHGMTPSFDGTPYKSTDENYSYVFAGWDKEILPVTADVTYTAQFEKTERVYTVKWVVDGVTTEQKYSYGDTPVYGGETPSRPSTSEYDFTFDGWSPEVTEVTADVTYVAQFRVFVKLQGLSLNKSAMFLDIGAGESLTANIYPAAASSKDVIWTSSDASVAAVDAYGKVTAANAGIAIVSVSSGDGSFKSYCVVTVSPKLTTYIEITANGVSTTNQKGSAVQLYAAVKPDDATDRTFKWTSDNSGIASVDEFGMVRFNAKGTTTIRVVTTDGYAQGSIEVTVTEQETTDETQKTYTVRFLNLMCTMYLIDDNGNSHTFGSNEVVVVPEGATIRFRPSRTSCYVIANGEQLERQNEYVIENIQKNYIISNSEAEIVTPDDNDSASSFVKKLQEFFRKIVEFFRKLFGKK